MGRNKMILAAAALMVLCSGTYAYGYWVDTVETHWNLALSYPIHIQVDRKEDVPETTAVDLTAIPQNSGSGSAENSGGNGDISPTDADNNAGEGSGLDSGNSSGSDSGNSSGSDSGNSSGSDSGNSSNSDSGNSSATDSGGNSGTGSGQDSSDHAERGEG